MLEQALRKEEVYSPSPYPLPPPIPLPPTPPSSYSSLPSPLTTPCVYFTVCLSANFSTQRAVREAILKKVSAGELPPKAAAMKPERKRKRWDQQTPIHDDGGEAKKRSAWDQAEVILSPPSLPLSLSCADIVLLSSVSSPLQLSVIGM